ncbi:translation initiation factor IF-2 [Streptomyces parvulus]|uniref:translation initiation factor IF-2 n=1 Tax=Streptomyces parvulus TaxID=146923 RepID=UPI0034088672
MSAGRVLRPLLLLAPLALLAVGCGAAEPSEANAADAAREAARTVGERLYGQRPRTAEEAGREAAGMDGVEVMRVDGTSTHDGKGLVLVVRTSGSAYNSTFDLEEVVVGRCFAVRVSPGSEWREEPRDVDCPESLPLVFGPAPEPPELPAAELRAKLPRVPEGGRADETEVRRVLSALDMDPAVRTEVQAEDGRVGVLLLVPGEGFGAQDCVLARVGPGETEVWVPPRVQRMRGEAGCTVSNALHPAPLPH